MNAVVCIKPVRLKYVNSQADNSNEWVINPYDLYSLSCLIRLKKEISDLQITCISMGPEDSQYILTRCLAMGADQGVLLSDRCFAGSDTYATSYILAEAIKKIGRYDLIVCGKCAVDGETGQVHVGLAYRLGIQCFIQVEKITGMNNTSIQFIRVIRQFRETIDSTLPVLLSFNKLEINDGLSLVRLKKARNIPIIVWNSKDINISPEYCGSRGSKTKVLDIRQNLEKKNSILIDGSIREKAQKLLEIIRQGEQ